MTMYKCDKCGTVFPAENRMSLYILDEKGNLGEYRVDLCGKCEKGLRKITTDFLYGEGAFSDRKAGHDYAMSMSRGA